MARHIMTPKRRAALKRAQAASARKRRKGVRAVKGTVRAQAKYSKRKNVAKAKRQFRAAKNEARAYKGYALKGASKLTGAKPKSRKNQALIRGSVSKKFVHGVKVNNAKYKKSTKFAKRVRKNEVRRAVKGR
jgi:hypothetical protein